MTKQKFPIINCHAHIFTGDHVPPYLGKSIMGWPLYRLLNFQRVFSICRWWFKKGPGKTRYGGVANSKNSSRYKLSMYIKRSFILNAAFNIIGWCLTLQALDFFLHWLLIRKEKPGWGLKFSYDLHDLLHNYLLTNPETWVRLLIIIVVVLFFKSGRNLLFFIAKNSISILKKLPGKETKELLSRYLLIGRFTFHRDQGKTFEQLKKQYPEGSGFVILPMDMEYMDAGKPTELYATQMMKLSELKDNQANHIYPFVFVDPRRIAEDPDFFRYAYVNGQVILEDCFIKEYIEDRKFSGFKIYPALGYYPFDALLLPLWKYAAQKQIPILTHCVRGPMYYRGKKKPAWDEHPVFKQSTKKAGTYDPLLLPETKNDEFSANFTHPMNFLCLLKKEFLAEAVYFACNAPGADPRLKEIFGLTISQDANGTSKPVITSGLDDLKICLGHYGGNDEWLRYFELDRLSYSGELSQHPDYGINFIYLKNTKTPAPGKPEQLWKYTDWYSIISSMILQHPNVYADISYILHSDSEILPLLKQTLRNKNLRAKILYGTDFFVVRNHKSDKHMLATMTGGLDEKDFDQIARVNPRAFLNLPIAKQTSITDKVSECLFSLKRFLLGS